MRFYGTLGNMQVLGNGSVVAPLKQELYNLFFPRYGLADVFFH